MKPKYVLFLLLLVALLAPSVSFTQPPPPPPPPVDTTEVPFDGGLTLLLAAGAGYGIKKIYRKRRQNGGATE